LRSGFFRTTKQVPHRREDRLDRGDGLVVEENAKDADHHGEYHDSYQDCYHQAYQGQLLSTSSKRQSLLVADRSGPDGIGLQAILGPDLQIINRGSPAPRRRDFSHLTRSSDKKV